MPFDCAFNASVSTPLWQWGEVAWDSGGFWRMERCARRLSSPHAGQSTDPALEGQTAPSAFLNPRGTKKVVGKF